MEKVERIISQKGFYFICTKVLYPDFIGPKYIIVTDDANISIKNPKTKGMIIVSTKKFKYMAEEYNRYFGNEDREKHRYSLYHNTEGYYEDMAEDEDGDTVGIEHQIIDYSIDIGELKDETDNSNYVIGALLNCEDTTSLFDWNNVSNRNYNVVIADKYAKKPGEEVNITNDPSYELTDIGTIETNGAVYNVEKYDYTASSFLSSLIVLTRKEQLEAVTADDVPEGHTRYENTIDVTDIIIKLQELGFKTYRINSGGFSLDTLGNAGSAVINHVDIRYVPDSETVYTEYDIRDFSDYLLGKEVDLSDGRNFDLNGDGVWDTFDLNQMKKRVAAAKTKE